jgi:hypothetical protein
MSNKKNFPPYMRSSVSAQFLAKNPLYKKVFMKCPNCAKFSLKPVNLTTIQDPQKIKDVKDRKCFNCGYLHKDLV